MTPAHPFFIVGVPRSGTTLLRAILDRHPEVTVPPESHFIPRLYARRHLYGTAGRVEHHERFLQDLARHPRFVRWGLPITAVRDELLKTPTATFAQAIDAVFRAYAARAGKLRWGDKTPGYAHFIDVLARLFPAAKFVHLIRDGRDVALSMLELDNRHIHAATPAYFWSRTIARTRAQAAALGDERYMEIRYEDVVARPEASVRRLCEFLDLTFQPAMLQHDGRILEGAPAQVQRWHRRLGQPVTPGLRDWRSQMSRRDLEEFEALGGAMLARLGYEVVTGRPLAARVRAWSRMSVFAVRAALWASPVLRRRVRKLDAADAAPGP